jgi:hypothetical protein
MPYTLANDGDDFEKACCRTFLPTEFPAYELFWLKHVIPLTNRPNGIQLRDDAALAAIGKNAEDLAMAQLHYTVLKHLFRADEIRRQRMVSEFELQAGLSALVGAQDVAFELLQRYTNRGTYDPWLEGRPLGSQVKNSGQDAQKAWKKANAYPLQQYRDYRNKLVHGRTPPGMRTATEIKLPSIATIGKYCDWRTVTAPGAAARIPAGDFETTNAILNQAWQATIAYFQQKWTAVLL